MENEHRGLIQDQIEEVQNEVLLINFIFSFGISISLAIVWMIFSKIFSNAHTSDESYIKFIEASAVLFAPFLAIIAQGFYYPLFRKLNALREMLFKDSLTESEIMFIYEK